jgi:hypothetical protein
MFINLISSAHNGGFFSNCFELKRTLVYIHLQYSIANQKSVRYSVSRSYFTNIAVGQNINKGFVYIMRT